MSDQSFDKFTLPGDIPDHADSAPSRSREGSETCRDDVGASRSGVGADGAPDDKPTPNPSREREGDYGVPTQDWLARGLRHPAGRGWEVEAVSSSSTSSSSSSSQRKLGSGAATSELAGSDPSFRWDDGRYGIGGGAEGAPLSDSALNARLAEYGVALRPAPGDKPWPGGWLPGDPPVTIETGEGADPFASTRVFDLARRVRFLDALATGGEVRAAAARVGVSRETCYRARRRHPDFKRLWDAALVQARAQAEGELATRALHGIEVPVFVRGEHVATWRKHDARLLLAHLGRLDRRVEQDAGAALRAERFDELLAAMAGHAPPEGFAEAGFAKAGCVEATGAAHDPYAGAVRADLPPTREECLAHARDLALAEFADPNDRWGDGWGPEAFDEEDAPLDPAEEEALRAKEERRAARAAAAELAEAETAARYDAWQAQGLARLDAILRGEEDESPRRRGPQATDAPPENAPASNDQAAGDPRLRGGSGKPAREPEPADADEDHAEKHESPRRRGSQATGAPAEDAPAEDEAAPHDQPARDPRRREGSGRGRRARHDRSARAGSKRGKRERKASRPRAVRAR